MPSSSKNRTPPGSIIAGPLTPPLTTSTESPDPITAILRALRCHRDGRKPSATRFKLGYEDYEELQRVLEDDEDLWGYVGDKVRSVVNETDLLVEC